MKYLAGCLIVLMFSLDGTAQMVSVTRGSAVLRNSPDAALSFATLEMPLNYPLEVTGARGEYLMVRDFEGTKGWVEKTSVAEKNCVVVRHEKVNLYGGPSENSEIIADARKGVAFTMEEQAGDWIKVAHESGLTGWLPLSALWGL